jgi:hypothetical protein
VTVERRTHVHEAVISLAEGADPQAVGGAVTSELCDAEEHDGPCRWPHNNTVVPGDHVSVFRTVFIAAQSEEREVRRRIRSALRSSEDWDVTSDRTRSLTPDERALVMRTGSGRCRQAHPPPIPSPLKSRARGERVRRPVSLPPTNRPEPRPIHVGT